MEDGQGVIAIDVLDHVQGVPDHFGGKGRFDVRAKMGE